MQAASASVAPPDKLSPGNYFYRVAIRSDGQQHDSCEMQYTYDSLCTNTTRKIIAFPKMHQRNFLLMQTPTREDRYIKTPRYDYITTFHFLLTRLQKDRNIQQRQFMNQRFPGFATVIGFRISTVAQLDKKSAVQKSFSSKNDARQMRARKYFLPSQICWTSLV